MKFHKEGRVSIALAAAVSLVFILIAYYGMPTVNVAKPIAIMLAVVLMVIILQFFRNPRRSMITDENAVIAPADGKVVVIEEVHDEEYFNATVRQISIFMSPTNVHINWFPISGEVCYSKYHPGKYLVAWHPKSSTDNERHSVVIKHPKFGEILVKQVAGALARRIVNYANEGQQAIQGEEMGFIKFGSRVDILLPLSAEVKVDLEQKSHGGQTVIAEFAQ